jgi:nicotinamidase-related amidase
MPQALLFVDIQNDYFPGGAMELEGSPEAGLRAGKLLRVFRERSLPVVHIQHGSTRAGATFFLPGTPGMQFHASAAPLESETVFRKHFPNAFRETPLLEHLRTLGITELVIAGMMTHMCIDTTVRAAADLGFSCRLAGDACATKALAFCGETIPARQVHAAFLSAIHGTFAKVMKTEEICAERFYPK